MRELERLLPNLNPPPGGLVRLQRNILAGRRHAVEPQWRWVSAMAVACALVAILAVWMPPWIAERQRTHTMVEALQKGLAPRLPASGILVVHGAAIELPSGQVNVKLYLVQSTAPAERAPIPKPHGFRVPSR